jgi:Icc-related predicted phosphoesterase
MAIRSLAVSDQIDPRIHSSTLRERMGDVRIVFGCGDVPARYLEFLADALDRPVYFVMGNHLEEITRRGLQGKAYQPMGCVDVGGKVVRDEWTGLLLAGIPGSPRYSHGEEQQYTDGEVSRLIWRMTPALLWNRLRYGRYVDVLITHAPPRGINDRPDPAHRGFPALVRFLRRFRPRYHLHGHIHLYDRSEPCESDLGTTRVINVYPYRVVDLVTAADGEAPPASSED